MDMLFVWAVVLFWILETFAIVAATGHLVGRLLGSRARRDVFLIACVPGAAAAALMYAFSPNIMAWLWGQRLTWDVALYALALIPLWALVYRYAYALSWLKALPGAILGFTLGSFITLVVFWLYQVTILAFPVFLVFPAVIVGWACVAAFRLWQRRDPSYAIFPR